MQETIPKTNKKKKSCFWSFVLMVLFIVLGMGLFSWWGWSYVSENYFNKINSEINVMEKSIYDLNSLKKSVMLLDNKMQKELMHLHEKINNTLTSEITNEIKKELKVQKGNEITSSKLILQNCLSTANMVLWTLQYKQDIKMAINLLEDLNVSLKNIKFDEKVNIRQAVISDIINLKNITSVDRYSLLKKLSSLTDKINGLKFHSVEKNNFFLQQQKTIDTYTEKFPGWKGVLDKLWWKIKSLVIVKRDNDIKPILLPDQKFLYKEGLVILLHQAQLSVLQHQDEIYQETLESAKYIFKKLSINDITIADDLEYLSKINISINVPSLNLLDVLQKDNLVSSSINSNNETFTLKV